MQRYHFTRLMQKLDEAGVGHFTLICGDILSGNLKSDQFDVIVGLGILHWLDQKKKNLLSLQIYELLRPNGKTVFIELLNINPILMAERWAARPWRPNLVWKHPFTIRELWEFCPVFDHFEIQYCDGLRLLGSLFVAFPGIFSCLVQVLSGMDERLSSLPFTHRLFSKAFMVLKKKEWTKETA